MLKSLCIALCLLSFSFSQSLNAQPSADQLNTQNSQKLVQVKIINRISGSKVTIGSGFFISANGLLATNYHVVKKAVLYPEDYKVTFIDSLDKEHDAEIADIDVVNDLAILKSSIAEAEYFHLAESLPEKGVAIYSMGNPSDIGMMVVPGTYNGLRTDSFIEYITFSGAINSGMSGGPAINSRSLVVGINVRNMPGKQIGFLIPVKKLALLLVKYQASNNTDVSQLFYEKITQQVTEHQSLYYQTILASEWPMDSLGSAIVPQKIQEELSCWGNSNDKDEKRQYQAVSSGCYLKDNIGIDNTRKRQTYVGGFKYSFEWIQSDKLNVWQLANLYQKRLKVSTLKNASSVDVSDYFCDQNIVLNQAQQRLKTTICTRSYRKFSGLYDVATSALLLGKDDQALVAKFYLNGVTQETAQAFSLKFMENIKWN